MKIFKNMMLVMALLMVAAVNAKNFGDKQPATTTRTGVVPQLQPVYTPRQPDNQQQGQQPIMRSAAEIDALFNELMTASVPWNNIIQKKYNDAHAAGVFSPTQERLLQQQYQLAQQAQEMRTLRRQTQTQQQVGLMQLPSAGQMVQQPQVTTEPWTFEGAAAGAATRAKALGTYGWERLKRGYGAAQSGISRLWGGYETSIGTGTKIALAIGAAAMAPYLGIAALAAPTVGLIAVLSGTVGIGTLALTSALDRLEHRYLTGEWTDEKATEIVMGALEEFLRDSLTYPTYTSKIEALSDINELYGSKDITNPVFANIVRKAHDKLKQAYTNRLSSSDTAIQSEENTFVRNVNGLRTNSSVPYNKSNAVALGNYANYLATTYDLVGYEAVLSEYRRALNMKDVIEKKLQAQTSQTPTQTPAQQQSAQPTTTPQTVTR